jgi:hypothetical protein
MSGTDSNGCYNTLDNACVNTYGCCSGSDETSTGCSVGCYGE